MVVEGCFGDVKLRALLDPSNPSPLLIPSPQSSLTTLAGQATAFAPPDTEALLPPQDGSFWMPWGDFCKHFEKVPEYPPSRASNYRPATCLT